MRTLSRIHDVYATLNTRTHTHTEPSDISPDSYPSSDGLGSFQLTKTEGEASREGSREGRKRSRQYRGATEEVLQGTLGVGNFMIMGLNSVYMYVLIRGILICALIREVSEMLVCVLI